MLATLLLAGGVTLTLPESVEVKGLEKLRETASHLGLQDFLAFIESQIGRD